nr:SpoIIE family protein phosphatase [Maliibacterium massiliense]
MMMHIDVAWKSLNKYGEELCGDKVGIVRTEDSDILVLSDGLGSGVKANILSTLTSKIITTMLMEGSSVDEAVETIAKTLPICKVRQIAYSTFSILQLYRDGRAYLVEFDSPACILVRGGKLTEIPCEVREIAGKSVRESRFDIAIGDRFTLMSDGIIHAGVGAILNLGWQWENAAAYVTELAQKKMSAPRAVASLLQVVDNFYMSKPGDDATALMAHVVPQKVVNLFSGPPTDKEKDETLVHDWMRGTGKKVVCGGTSANIVGRVLHREVRTSLDFSDPLVPPIGFIQGVDLVTEGVLTINRTLEILRGAIKSQVDAGDATFREIDADNGAARLARLLLEDCTDLHMFVGKAINPAHQNPNLPMDLSIKMRLLNELCDVMRQAGKRVEVTYY